MVRAPKCLECGKPARRGWIVEGGNACPRCVSKLLAGERGMKLADKLKPKPIPETFKGRTPTDEQREIMELIRDGPKMVIIEAGAGTGKTTQLEMLAQIMYGNGQYTAFNRALVTDSKPKFRGTKVACATTHGLAFREVGKDYSHRLNGPRTKATDLAKMLGIEEFTVDTGDEGTKRIAPGFLAARVKMAIAKFCQSADPELSYSHFRYIDGIDSNEGGRSYDNNQLVREYLLPFAKKMWEDVKNPQGVMPFTHDCYVKIWELGNPVIAADYILLDEAQDTAPVMLSVLEKQTAMIVLVGDSAQQIYEWRGAINAMASFPGAPRKFLSQSFRFGEAIAECANMVLEELDEGTELRLKGHPDLPSRIDEVEEPDAILTRTNAAAVNALLEAMAAEKKPYMVGGGSAMISFMEAVTTLQRGESTSHPDLACFDSWPEVEKYAKEDEGEDLKLLVKLIQGFGATEILQALKAMPEEKDADIVISTAHKSKGREWNKVRLANDFPSRDKCGDPERKLLYVAVTRAKRVLDISCCPFFTGEQGADISFITRKQPSEEEAEESLVPPTPSEPPKGEFSWRRDRESDSWCVRGPSGHNGQTVTVTRKDGSSSQKYLGDSVWDNDGVSLYRV